MQTFALKKRQYSQFDTSIIENASFIFAGEIGLALNSPACAQVCSVAMH